MRRRNWPWFPELAEHVETDGDAVALLFVALEAKVSFVLAQAFPGDLQAFVILPA
jgi:hypothetical protein